MNREFTPIETERCIIRPLSVFDVSERYLAWLNSSDARKWISYSDKSPKISDLRLYVEKKTGRDDVLFLGIFDKKNGGHVGNIKFDPLVHDLKATVVGVLIGEPAYRGIGLFEEIFIPAARWLFEHKGVVNIYLGVDRGNVAALKAYKKMGFYFFSVSEREKKFLGDVSMVLNLGNSYFNCVD